MMSRFRVWWFMVALLAGSCGSDGQAIKDLSSLDQRRDGVGEPDSPGIDADTLADLKKPTDHVPQPDGMEDVPDGQDAKDLADGALQPDGDSTDPGCTPETADEDCESGMGCVDGLCGICTLSLHCAPGSACRSGVCGPCTKRTDCREGEGCSDGNCGPCESADWCDGQLCVDGECVSCAGDQSCQPYGEDYSCVAGVCVPDSCTSDADCMLAGQICSAQTFKCQACTSTSQCLESTAYGSGYMCLNGLCTQGNCLEDSDCPPDQPICSEAQECRGCQPTTEGADAECIQRFGVGYLCTSAGTCVAGDCLSHADCIGVGGLCELGPQGTGAMYYCRPCVSNTEDSLCSTASGLNNMICHEGNCIEGCATGTGCANGQVCKQDHRCASCGSNTECATGFGAGYLCYAGTCEPGECNESQGCPAGEICADKVCRGCLAHGECGDGQICDFAANGGNGLCETGECSAATQDELCPSTHLCVSYVCTTCESHESCGPNRYCDQMGVCHPAQCTDAFDCAGSKQLCQSLGQTLAPPYPFTCRPCNDFSEDEACRQAYGLDDLICDGGQCRSGCAPAGPCPTLDGRICGPDRRCTACTSNSQCSTAYASYLCIDGICSDAQCNEEKPCANGKVCDPINHVCRVCYADQECPAGNVCDNGPAGTSLCYPGECTPSIQDSHCSTHLCDYQTRTCVSCIGKTCPAGSFCGADGVCYSGTCAIDQDCQSQNTQCATYVCQQVGGVKTCVPQIQSGKACNDGNPCNLEDKCDAQGNCVGMGAKCADNHTCTNDTCDPTTGACSFPVKDGTCFIGGFCYNLNDSQPGVPCMKCTGTSQTSWTAVHELCADGIDCTTNKCGASGCFVESTDPNMCLIAGTCYPNTTKDPTNLCRICDVTKSKTAWTNTSASEICGVCQRCNGSGVCTAYTGTKTGSECSTCQYCNGGACANQALGQDLSSECTQSQMITCGLNGNCDGTGVCAIWTKEQTFNLISDNNECTDDYCTNGKAYYTPVTGNKKCVCSECNKPYLKKLCFGTSCTKDCTSNSECGLGNVCCGGFCKPECCTSATCGIGMLCGEHTHPPSLTPQWGCYEP